MTQLTEECRALLRGETPSEELGSLLQRGKETTADTFESEWGKVKGGDYAQRTAFLVGYARGGKAETCLERRAVPAYSKVFRDDPEFTWFVAHEVRYE